MSDLIAMTLGYVVLFVIFAIGVWRVAYFVGLLMEASELAKERRLP